MEGIGALARMLIVVGLALAAIGVLLLVAPRVPWLGRLPGDIVIRRDGFTLYLPLATCLVLSLLLTAIFWVVNLLRR
jgi:hypothetical protein